MRNVKGIPWDLQHRLVVVGVDEKILKKIVEKEQSMARSMWKLNEY